MADICSEALYEKNQPKIKVHLQIFVLKLYIKKNQPKIKVHLQIFVLKPYIKKKSTKKVRLIRSEGWGAVNFLVSLETGAGEAERFCFLFSIFVSIIYIATIDREHS